MEEANQAQKGKLHFGYLVVAALVLTSFIPLSLALSCAGIFYPPLSEALGVEKGVLSYYISVLWLACGIVGSALFAFVWGTVVSLTGSYVAMFGGAMVLMAITCIVVVAIARMQAKLNTAHALGQPT